MNGEKGVPNERRGLVWRSDKAKNGSSEETKNVENGGVKQTRFTPNELVYVNEQKTVQNTGKETEGG